MTDQNDLLKGNTLALEAIAEQLQKSNDLSAVLAARFAKEDELRVSGLLWPEARERWAETVFATREGYENGQIILFATDPNFRGYFHNT